jgi:hypothetical protein
MSGDGIRKDQAVQWIYMGIVLLLFISGPMHSAFEGLGRPVFTAAVLPVNESVFEHLKLAFWPLFFWWLLGYVLYIRQGKGDVNRWFLAAMSTIFVSPLFILVFYYTYTGALGIHSLLLDILSLPLSLLIAQSLAVHIYRYARGPRWAVPAFIAAAIFLIVVFALFTYQPPRIPMFLDTSTGRYGLN